MPYLQFIQSINQYVFRKFKPSEWETLLSGGNPHTCTLWDYSRNQNDCLKNHIMRYHMQLKPLCIAPTCVFAQFFANKVYGMFWRIHIQISCIIIVVLFKISQFDTKMKTSIAFVWLYPTVCFQMSPQISCLKRGVVTLVAFGWLFPTMCFQMYPQITTCIRGCLITLVAFF